jgi:superfamily II DNA/RNA helicase
MSFASFNLNANLLKALEAGNFTTPTPVQAQSIPHAVAGKDVMASAQTGTGKTAAFVLPALNKILSGPSPVKNRGPRVLVLTPTRELAQQVLDNVRTLGKFAQIRTGVIVGGVSYGPQYQLLKNPLDVLVATPGRLIDHLNEKLVDFSRIETVILDEADKMLDMGFLKPVERILASISGSAPRPQILLFSATFTPSVDKFARQVLHSPVRIELAPIRNNNTQITQHAYQADSSEHKLEMLFKLLGETTVGQAIIFSATKHGSEKLAKRLTQQGFASAALHGGMRQNLRKKTLDQLHTGNIRFLVATDVAARGIDVKQLSHVFNYDLPQVAEDYVHRIGRTGRAGETGIAISLISPSDVPMLRDIEKILGKRMELGSLAGHEPRLSNEEFARQGAAAPRSRKGMNGGGGGRPQGNRSQGGGNRSGANGGDRGKPSSYGPSKGRSEGRPGGAPKSFGYSKSRGASRSR